jgi:hypothetical protein
MKEVHIKIIFTVLAITLLVLGTLMVYGVLHSSVFDNNYETGLVCIMFGSVYIIFMMIITAIKYCVGCYNCMACSPV